jgi:anti-sigma factor RsiW
MRHVGEVQLIRLVFGELAGKELDACLAHLKDCPGCSERLVHFRSAVALLENHPTEPPPPYAWSKIKARIERSGTSRDWDEPAWLPLVLGNAAGILLVILVIWLVGGWLGRTSVWQTIRTWPLAREVGPRSLIALVFFGAGALITLALTPIYWWESRNPQNRVVK